MRNLGRRALLGGVGCRVLGVGDPSFAVGALILFPVSCSLFLALGDAKYLFAERRVALHFDEFLLRCGFGSIARLIL